MNLKDEFKDDESFRLAHTRITKQIKAAKRNCKRWRFLNYISTTWVVVGFIILMIANPVFCFGFACFCGYFGRFTYIGKPARV